MLDSIRLGTGSGQSNRDTRHLPGFHVRRDRGVGWEPILQNGLIRTDLAFPGPSRFHAWHLWIEYAQQIRGS
jgi:hypothetical protein